MALKWLIPRLHDFERRFPDMKVKLSTAYFDWDFDETNVDCGLILARNKPPTHQLSHRSSALLDPGLLARAAAQAQHALTGRRRSEEA